MAHHPAEAEREFDLTNGVVTQGGPDVGVSMSWMLTLMLDSCSVRAEIARKVSGCNDGLMWRLGTKAAGHHKSRMVKQVDIPRFPQERRDSSKTYEVQ
jgi:hypothetical protein